MASKGLGPRLSVDPAVEAAQGGGPVALCALDVSVCVTAGCVAESTWLMTFRNSVCRDLETTLIFPLPDGAVLSGYGIETNGVMLEAIPVEKEKAQVAFESAVRSGQTAAVAHHAVGNQFTTRVYPVPASSTKQVKVRFDLALSGPSYAIPLVTTTPLERFSMRVDVFEQPQQPPPTAQFHPTDAATKLDVPAFTQFGTTYSLHLAEENLFLSGDIVIEIPELAGSKESKAEPEVFVFKFTESSSSGTFFLVNDFPLEAEQEKESTKDIEGERIVIVYDLSRSRATANLNLERKILHAILAQQQDAGIKEADVVLLRNVAEQPTSFPASDPEAILGFLEGNFADGGTQISSIDVIGELHKTRKYKMAFIFSDGVNNLGSELPAAGATLSVPLNVFTSSTVSNFVLLKYLAQVSGGYYFDLCRGGEEELLVDVTRALGKEAVFQFVGASFDPTSVEDVFPVHPVPAVCGVGGRFPVTGRLLKSDASVTLNYGFGGVVTRSVTVQLVASQASPMAAMCRLWAQRKVRRRAACFTLTPFQVDHLSLFGEQHKAEIQALARQYNFVAPGMSLLVLESLDQVRTRSRVLIAISTRSTE
eukprot:TRINITY_DN2895_c0_g1_i1.p1 TRINITY_DN2895_c0_g1~~TRINITY_DN2895_c0_g1_i1.p1  ORF type:complete len:607 (+),score=118.28 TRINITY_DN2895_c0_g1_i1:45-1823(+)